MGRQQAEMVQATKIRDLLKLLLLLLTWSYTFIPTVDTSLKTCMHARIDARNPRSKTFEEKWTIMSRTAAVVVAAILSGLDDVNEWGTCDAA